MKYAKKIKIKKKKKDDIIEQLLKYGKKEYKEKDYEVERTNS